MKNNKILAIAAAFLIAAFAAFDANSARIKDIAVIEGAGYTQVIGYGLVTGLNNSGDNQRTTFTVQSVSNMLKRFGLTVPQTNPRIRNVAAVMVTANVPNFSRPGAQVDIQVSSIGDATSLQGGILLMTPVSTANGEIIGMAQGAVSVGGYDFRAFGSRVGRNFVTAGRVPNGLMLETETNSNYLDGSIIRLQLREPDFTTASRVAAAITGLGGNIASATPINAGSIEVTLNNVTDMTEVISAIEQIEAQEVTADAVARVVVNERTGTIVVGGNVELSPAVIAHGGLEISIQKQFYYPPQPIIYPYSIYPPEPYPPYYYDPQRYLEIKEQAELEANEELNRAVPLDIEGISPTVQQMADALNLLNVSPRDLVSIFQALKDAGALQGELIIQ